MGKTVDRAVDYEVASMRVGDIGDATTIRDIVAGTVAVSLAPVAANGAIASASAAVQGITTNHKVLLIPQTRAADEQVIIAAAIGIANGIQVTASNPHSAAISAGSANYTYFAWR